MTQSKTIYPQTAMLSNVMELLLKQPTITTEAEAFQSMLEIIAYKLSYEVMIQTPWLQQEISEEVDRVLDLDLLREDKWDWLGEVYELRVSTTSPLPTRSMVDDYIVLHPVTAPMNKIHTILDQVADTGRLILRYADSINNQHPTIFYGAVRSIEAYRIAILNCKLHDINFRILCADWRDVDLRPQSPNWKYANLWKPVEEKKLFTEEQVNDLGLKTMGDPPAVYYLR